MKLVRWSIFTSALLMVFLPMVAFAAADGWLGLVPCGTPDKPCTVACFYVMIDKIINFILWSLAMPLAATALMVAGIMLLFGNSENTLNRGKAIFKSTLIGLFVAFAAWLIIDLILRGLLGGSYLPWTKFPAGNCQMTQSASFSATNPNTSTTNTLTPSLEQTISQTSPEWTNWLTNNENLENAGINAIDTEVPSSVDSSLLENIDTPLLPGSKTYIKTSAFSSSEIQSLESAAAEARSFFGSSYQSKVNNTSVFVCDTSEYSNINEAYSLSLEERGKVSTGDMNKIVNGLNSSGAYFTPSTETVIMNGDTVLGKDYSSYGVTQVFIHEYAHGVEEVLPSSQSSQYAQIYESAYESGGFVSNYAKTNAGEDFAETIVAYYNTNGNTSLISNDPAIQQSIQARFDYLKKNGIVK